MNYQERITKLGNMLKALGIKSDIIQVNNIGVFITHDKDSTWQLAKILRKSANTLKTKENIPAWVTSSKLNDSCRAFIFNFTGEEACKAQSFEVRKVIARQVQIKGQA